MLFTVCNLHSQGETKAYKALKDFDFKVADYIKYNFEERKEYYIGKPLSVLFKDCEVPIKSTIEAGCDGVVGICRVLLLFESKIIWANDPPTIRVNWQDALSPIARDVSHAEKMALFSKQIVTDVRAFGKNFSELPPMEKEDNNTFK